MSEPKHAPPVRPYGGVSAPERVALRRAALLDAGLELFGTEGYARTRVKDLCRQAGLTDRYFYESFAGTDELFLAVFDRIIDELFVAVAEAVAVADARVVPQLRGGSGTSPRSCTPWPMTRASSVWCSRKPPVRATAPRLTCGPASAASVAWWPTPPAASSR
jgi:AcrR family transcriptional regulator